MPGRSHPRFDALTVPKASDVLASEVRERILRRVHRGHGAAAGASTRRADGAEPRHGTGGAADSRGGEAAPDQAGPRRRAFVHRPGRESLASTVQLVIRGQRIRLEALHETREAIEPTCAALAAVRRTDRDLAELDAAQRDLVEAGDDIPRFLRANIDWHSAVARASDNELLIGFMSALAVDLRRHEPRTVHGRRDPLDHRPRAREDHRRDPRPGRPGGDAAHGAPRVRIRRRGRAGGPAGPGGTVRAHGGLTPASPRRASPDH